MHLSWVSFKIWSTCLLKTNLIDLIYVGIISLYLNVKEMEGRKKEEHNLKGMKIKVLPLLLRVLREGFTAS